MEKSVVETKALRMLPWGISLVSLGVFMTTVAFIPSWDLKAWAGVILALMGGSYGVAAALLLREVSKRE